MCKGRKVNTVASGFRPGDFPIGSVESRAAARALVSGLADEQDRSAMDQLGELNEIERALIDDDKLDPLARSYVVRLYRAALEREQVYGMSLPRLTAEGIRHTHAVRQEIDRMTGGQSYFLATYDKPEWNRLQEIAEQNLKNKDR